MCLCVRDLGLVGKGCDVRGRVCVVARASRICAACLNLRGRTPVVGRRVSVTVATVTVTEAPPTKLFKAGQFSSS